MSGVELQGSKSSNGACTKESRRLEIQSMRNWIILATICATSTSGLIIAVTPVLNEGIADFWPWENTGLVLLVGLAGSMLLLVLHLTMQQFKVASMLRRARSTERHMNERQQQTASRLHALANVSRMMGAVTDPASVFDAITSTCLEIFDCQQASLMLLSARSDMLEVKAASGHLDVEKLRSATQPIGQGIAGYVAKNKEPLILNKDTDMSRFPDLQLESEVLTAAMIAPILVRDELVGVLNISSRSSDTSYDDEDLSALNIFAENAGTCIHHAERSEWMRQTIERQQRSMTEETEVRPLYEDPEEVPS